VGRQRLAGLFVTVAVLATACGRAPRMERPVNEIDEDRYRDQLTTLAGADFAGRRPGTDGEARTVAYLSEQFRRLKLKPVSGDSYLQSVPLVEITPAGSPSLTVTGPSGVHALASPSDMVLWSRREEPLVSLRGNGVVFAGFGVSAPAAGRDDYAGLDVHGRIVVVLAGAPEPSAGPAGAAPAHQPGFYARADYKAAEAARHGANGLLILYPPQGLGRSWEQVVAETGGVRIDRVPETPGTPLLALEGWLSADAGRALFAAAGIDYAATLAAASGSGFHALPLALSIDAQLSHTVRRFTSSNVIGVLPGGHHHDEAVVVSAHWDSLGVQSGPAGTELYPGAVDNASGVAGLLQLARLFTRAYPQPARSLVFIALTGGEANLAGSAWYVDHPLFPLADTVADLNLDTLHIGGPTRDLIVFGLGQSELDGYVRNAATLQGREVHADDDPRGGAFYGSDSFSFAAHGVPSLYAIGGYDDAARGPGWGRDARRDYLQNRRHRPLDGVDPDWDLRGTVDDLRLYYRVGMGLAQGGRFPNWYRSSEFHAAGATERGN
jgi:hypothetical protein